MPTYVSLINWTDQGITSFKDTVHRSEEATGLATKLGGEIKAIYWTVGPYDIISVAEFPDDKAGTAFLLAIGAQGNLRTTTLRAHSAEEMAEIISKVG